MICDRFSSYYIIIYDLFSSFFVYMTMNNGRIKYILWVCEASSWWRAGSMCAKDFGESKDELVVTRAQARWRWSFFSSRSMAARTRSMVPSSLDCGRFSVDLEDKKLKFVCKGTYHSLVDRARKNTSLTHTHTYINTSARTWNKQQQHAREDEKDARAHTQIHVRTHTLSKR